MGVAKPSSSVSGDDWVGLPAGDDLKRLCPLVPLVSDEGAEGLAGCEGVSSGRETLLRMVLRGEGGTTVTFGYKEDASSEL